MKVVEEGAEICRQCHYVFHIDEMTELPEGIFVCDGCYAWLEDMLDGEDADS